MPGITMHTCLSLANLDCHSEVEADACRLAERLNAYCDSIDSCYISVDQPAGEGGARYWRVSLRLRVFNESVCATKTRPTAGAEPRQSLAPLLDDVYAVAIEKLTQIAKRHHGCCAVAQGIAGRTREFA